MNFYIVFCKTKRKFDKYIKINRIRNKVIVDIPELLNEFDIKDNYQDYFNLMVYTKINHSLRKGKTIYYIPDFKNSDIDITEIFKLKEILDFDINFNVLVFYEEFMQDNKIINDVIGNLDFFNSSQIIRDY